MNYKFEFRSGLSTEGTLYAVTKIISNTLDNGDKALAIFLDLVKAFDKVNHSLLNILSNFEINGISLLRLRN